MAAFTAKSIWHNNYLLLFEIFLLCWAISIWNVSRILLSAANLQKLVETQIDDEELKKEQIDVVVKRNDWVVVTVDQQYRNVINVMIKWTPRVLAIFPYIIFIGAYQQQADAFNGNHPINIILVIIIAVLHMLYMIYRKWLWAKLSPNNKADN